MTVARELPNCDNWQHLSNRAIYLMANLGSKVIYDSSTIFK